MLAGPDAQHRPEPQSSRHSCGPDETRDLPDRDARCAGWPRSQEHVGKAPRSRADGPPCAGTRREKRGSHATVPLAVVPTPGSSFHLHKMACRYGDAGWKRLIHQEVTSRNGGAYSRFRPTHRKSRHEAATPKFEVKRYWGLGPQPRL